MPELPEVESARGVIARSALGRRINQVDDTDRYVCRPHASGEIAHSLNGRSITHALRRGKQLKLCLSGPGPTLGIHLGMSGRVIVDGEVGGDPRFDGMGDLDSSWTRFRIFFADGGYLAVFDKRRLARVTLNPNLDLLGPDALTITRRQFCEQIASSNRPIKARLLDQRVVAGVGNLLADQVLWAARISPLTPASTLTRAELAHLQQTLLSCTLEAIQQGGVHTASLVPHRKPEGRCPRCGHPMQHAIVGGRATWWCPGVGCQQEEYQDD